MNLVIIVIINQAIHQPITVLTLFNRNSSHIQPVKIKWEGQEYTVTEIGMHYKKREAGIVHHIFTVSDGLTFFCLDLNTDSLQWSLQEISDGLVN